MHKFCMPSADQKINQWMNGSNTNGRGRLKRIQLKWTEKRRLQYANSSHSRIKMRQQTPVGLAIVTHIFTTNYALSQSHNDSTIALCTMHNNTTNTYTAIKSVRFQTSARTENTSTIVSLKANSFHANQHNYC